MAVPQVNGDVPSSASNSAFVQHLLSYPLIKDSIHTFQSNEYGQKSIQLGDSAYKTFAAPVVPYLAKPYEYVSPYVQKADSLGDKTLNRIDAQFPVVKKPTSDIYNDTKTLIFLPYQKGLEGKDHVFKVYSNEVKKNDQQSLIAQGKAVVITVLVVGTETLSWLGRFLNSKKEQVNHTVNDKASH
ncbi:perilipin MPL1-like protein [Stachybotrys elegans]|uniref:Perilipin MPL1-like protein n=1 Tax=Stachybotrys elegans TaxID=80388 RepID=A0A8K0SZV4_9HYPO|nr:perilipin MPL1-like protein [Stachybotrys elegans]